MKEIVQINDFSADDLAALIYDVIQRETAFLRKEVIALRQELHRNRKVLTLREATYYFDSKVTAATIAEYIMYCGLPAFKNGRLWFVYRQDLLDWQIGLIGHPSTKKLGIKRIVSPRYHGGELNLPKRS